MNRYGQLAQAHWKTWRPQAYSELEDPQAFFTDLGVQVQEAIVQAEDPTPPQTTDYLQAVGMLNAARSAAQEAVLAEMVFAVVEPQTQDEDLDRPVVVNTVGMPADPYHPLWDLQDDPDVTQEQFRAALQAWWASLPPQDRR